MGECSFDDPALGAESEATLRAPAGGMRLHAEVPDEVAVLVVVVAVLGPDHFVTAQMM
ncbi:hypothetical protein [Streptomyces sp. NRRL S-1813]|uniref:hypothetical protein n=1 Tax=Streptomyces sp. NRRL S-1813 TaxID=1463888 RepID=UPI0018FE787C|nr:hypothetical protein [Streptomyces sp. NRRL S-1813]